MLKGNEEGCVAVDFCVVWLGFWSETRPLPELAPSKGAMLQALMTLLLLQSK
jgi:hypothetical protein